VEVKVKVKVGVEVEEVELEVEVEVEGGGSGGGGREDGGNNILPTDDKGEEPRGFLRVEPLEDLLTLH